MQKKQLLSNSTILLIGIIIITIGITIGSLEFLKEKKDKVFSKMNIMLYENETPKNIVDDSNQNENNVNEGDNNSNDNIENDEENTSQNENSSSYKPNYIGILEIPKLNLKKGFFGLDYKYNSVDYNITVINGSTFPDTNNNNLILAAHSGNCSICYFKTLYKLNIGDIAYLTYLGETHTYKIVNIYEVEKTGTVTIYRNYNTKVLTLITCTKNNNYTQTVYILEIEE